MSGNAAREALTGAANRAIADGAPEYVEMPKPYDPSSTFVVRAVSGHGFQVFDTDLEKVVASFGTGGAFGMSALDLANAKAQELNEARAAWYAENTPQE